MKMFREVCGGCAFFNKMTQYGWTWCTLLAKEQRDLSGTEQEPKDYEVPTRCPREMEHLVMGQAEIEP